MPSNPPPDPTPGSIARDPALGIAAEALGARLPALMVAAQRVAQTVSQGAHGRRRVGLGESFWQFRPYQTDDTIDRIDWRQSAKGDRLYIRETEWAAAQTVWLWRDFGPGMEYRSTARLPIKQVRAELLLLALASLLVRGGERVALLGGRAPTTGRGAVDAILAGLGRDQPLAQIGRAVARHATLVLFGDFLAPIEEIAQGLDRVAAGGGVAGQLIQILDPAEADLTFSGRVRFREMADDARVRQRRAGPTGGGDPGRPISTRCGASRTGWPIWRGRAAGNS